MNKKTLLQKLIGSLLLTHKKRAGISLAEGEKAADPVQSGLIHTLRVLFQLALAVRPQALDVGREVWHVGHPGHRSLVHGLAVPLKQQPRMVTISALVLLKYPHVKILCMK